MTSQYYKNLADIIWRNNMDQNNLEPVIAHLKLRNKNFDENQFHQALEEHPDNMDDWGLHP